jgi:hypothetical protein
MLSLVVLTARLGLQEPAEEKDFSAFYLAGWLARSGHGHLLYDNEIHAELRKTLWDSESRVLPYLNPPFYALLMAPFTYLPPNAAIQVWRAVQLALAAWSFVLMAGMVGLRNSLTYLLLFLAAWPSMHVTILAQNSFLSLLALALGLYLLDRKLDGQAGLVLAIGLIKPQLTVLVPVMLIVLRRWHGLAGFATGTLLLYLVSAIPAGLSWPWSYLSVVSDAAYRMGQQENVPAMPSLAGALRVACSDKVNPLFIMAALGVVAAILMFLHGRLGARAHSMSALTVVLTLLISPHILSYDLVLLVWPCLVLLSSHHRHLGPAVALLMVFSFLAPLLAGLVPVQPVAIIMIWLAIMLWRQPLPTVTQGRNAGWPAAWERNNAGSGE